jgi:hypothetical protein
LDTVKNVLFAGYDEALFWNKTVHSVNSTTSSTAKPWIGMPVTLAASQTISAFMMTAGMSGVSSAASRTNAGTVSFGVYSSSAGTLSTIWTSSLGFSQSISSSSQSFTFGAGASSNTFSSVTAATNRLFLISVPVTLTLQSGTYYFGQMEQMTASGGSFLLGGLSDPLSAAAVQGLVLGSSLTQAIGNPIGIITANITGNAVPAAFPLSLTNQVTGSSYSRYPYAIMM